MQAFDLELRTVIDDFVNVPGNDIARDGRGRAVLGDVFRAERIDIQRCGGVAREARLEHEALPRNIGKARDAGRQRIGGARTAGRDGATDQIDIVEIGVKFRSPRIGARPDLWLYEEVSGRRCVGYGTPPLNMSPRPPCADVINRTCGDAVSYGNHFWVTTILLYLRYSFFIQLRRTMARSVGMPAFCVPVCRVLWPCA